jgi:hypothetical protein
MKPWKRMLRVFSWAVIVLLLNAALSTCTSYESKVENEPDPEDTSSVRAVVDSTTLPVFSDSLSVAGREDTLALPIPTALTFGDSALGDTLYSRKAEGQPIYKKWWVLALVGAIVAATAAILASGDEGDREDLPGFPDPPQR